MERFIRCAVLTLTVAMSAGALAGPAFTEPPMDAGSSKATAADASGIAASGTISGTLTGTTLVRGVPDFEDMYIISIHQPGRWQVSTTPITGRHLGFAEFNSVLWLFQFSDERGRLANDDAFPPPGDVGARFRNMATDGTSLTITAPGLYLLAVSVQGRIPVDQFNNPLFHFALPTEVSGPDGSTLPLHHWVGVPEVEIPGSYTIEITVPPCPGDANGDGMVGLSDISAVIATWGQTVPQGFGADLDGNGVIGIGDIAQILTFWAQPCF